jgi:hypothetical protein
MTNKVSVIGIEPHELRWIKMLVSLLRHPDPGMPELARQALMYLLKSSDRSPAGELREKKSYPEQKMVF